MTTFKTITLSPAVTISVRTTKIGSVRYNNAAKTCSVGITFNGLHHHEVTFSGDAYTALGQWTDASLEAAVLARLGLTPS